MTAAMASPARPSVRLEVFAASLDGAFRSSSVVVVRGYLTDRR